MNRREYELTEEQLSRILDACKPTPVMYGSGGVKLFSTPQENANRAWQIVAMECGFVWDSVEPIEGKGRRFISAIPNVP